MKIISWILFVIFLVIFLRGVWGIIATQLFEAAPLSDVSSLQSIIPSLIVVLVGVVGMIFARKIVDMFGGKKK